MGQLQMSHFFDKVGYMVEADYVDNGLVTAAFKSSAKFWWGVLEPFIREEAEKKRPDKKYQDSLLSKLAEIDGESSPFWREIGRV